jgi:hypothetical protein
LRSAGEADSRKEDRAADPLRSLDWDHLAEEIEGLARGDRRELVSRLASIVDHLAKLEFSLSIAPRAEWTETVMRDRAEIDSILQDSPSLRDIMPEFLASRTDGAIRLAVRCRNSMGKPTRLRNCAMRAVVQAIAWMMSLVSGCPRRRQDQSHLAAVPRECSCAKRMQLCQENNVGAF